MTPTAHLDSGLVPGSLVAICGPDGQARPALVVANDPAVLTVHVGGELAAAPGDSALLAWGLDGGVRELRARVLRREAASDEVQLTPDGEVASGDDRRVVTRFALSADALLVIDGIEHAGAALDLSVLGAGLVLPEPAPVLGAVGELCVYDAGELLLPGCAVRVSHVTRDADGRRSRVGVHFADPARAADVTSSLLAALARCA